MPAAALFCYLAIELSLDFGYFRYSNRTCFCLFSTLRAFLFPIYIFRSIDSSVMRTPISRYRSEIGAKKYIKGPGNAGTMENRLNETGADFGKTSCLPKSRSRELIADSVCRKEPAEGEGLHKSNWSNPEASKQLIKQLLQLVNSKEEYELIEQDLVELEFLTTSPSELIERRCCRNCSQVK
jgi:hypothetical protein